MLTQVLEATLVKETLLPYNIYKEIMFTSKGTQLFCYMYAVKVHLVLVYSLLASVGAVVVCTQVTQLKLLGFSIHVTLLMLALAVLHVVGYDLNVYIVVCVVVQIFSWFKVL